VQGWVQTLTGLQQFIRQHHTTGLVWAGKSAPAAPAGKKTNNKLRLNKKNSNILIFAVGGAPPPPPPGCPPPPPVLDMSQMNLDDSSHDRSALFAQINKGEDVTSGMLLNFFSVYYSYFILGLL
jgi:adenylyl cyclase-associated protein